MIKYTEGWLVGDFSADIFLELVKKRLIVENYLDINLVDLTPMVNYQDKYNKNGFTRITARAWGKPGIHFSVTVANDLRPCTFWVETDAFDILIHQSKNEGHNVFRNEN